MIFSMLGGVQAAAQKHNTTNAAALIARASQTKFSRAVERRASLRARSNAPAGVGKERGREAALLAVLGWGVGRVINRPAEVAVSKFVCMRAP